MSLSVECCFISGNNVSVRKYISVGQTTARTSSSSAAPGPVCSFRARSVSKRESAESFRSIPRNDRVCFVRTTDKSFTFVFYYCIGAVYFYGTKCCGRIREISGKLPDRLLVASFYRRPLRCVKSYLNFRNQQLSIGITGLQARRQVADVRKCTDRRIRGLNAS